MISNEMLHSLLMMTICILESKQATNGLAFATASRPDLIHQAGTLIQTMTTKHLRSLQIPRL
jgi:hypothetical protein